jgi:uncharacterized protein GlcG (DUF336 family)
MRRKGELSPAAIDRGWPHQIGTFSQPSADFVKRLQDRPDTIGSRHCNRILALAGGLPIKVGDEIVGAVGVSGTPGKDDDCSQAGINKVADQLK